MLKYFSAALSMDHKSSVTWGNAKFNQTMQKIEKMAQLFLKVCFLQVLNSLVF